MWQCTELYHTALYRAVPYCSLLHCVLCTLIATSLPLIVARYTTPNWPSPITCTVWLMCSHSSHTELPSAHSTATPFTWWLAKRPVASISSPVEKICVCQSSVLSSLQGQTSDLHAVVPAESDHQGSGLYIETAVWCGGSRWGT